MNPFDTQKVRLDLQAELLQVEREAIATNDVKVASELAAKIRWLVRKINFLNSPEYRVRKQKAAKPTISIRRPK